MSKARDLANVGSGAADLNVSAVTATGTNPSVYTEVTPGAVIVQNSDYLEGNLQEWRGQPTNQGVIAYVGGDGTLWTSYAFTTPGNVNAGNGSFGGDVSAGSVYATNVYASGALTINGQAVGLANTLTRSIQGISSYTLILSDALKNVEMDHASANTVTIPAAASVNFPVGTQILISQYGAGQTTIAADAGVTIRSNGAKMKLAGQFAQATLVKRATNEWYLSGNLVA